LIGKNKGPCRNIFATNQSGPYQVNCTWTSKYDLLWV